MRPDPERPLTEEEVEWVRRRARQAREGDAIATETERRRLAMRIAVMMNDKERGMLVPGMSMRELIAWAHRQAISEDLRQRGAGRDSGRRSRHPRDCCCSSSPVAAGGIYHPLDLPFPYPVSSTSDLPGGGVAVSGEEELQQRS